MSSEIKKIFGYDFDKDFGEEFYTLVESKKLIFFVGAGVSRLMGLPGWNELATNLIKEAFPNYIEHTTILNSIKDSKELISISYNEMKNSEDKEEKFFKCFGKALTPKKNFTFEKNVYELLSKFEANFLTTNADNLFEEILGEERCHVGPNKPDFNRFRKHLYYLHGHYTSNKNHDQDYLVFTAEQYIQRYNDTDFQAFLHSVFNQGNTIIFIGYGLNEFEIIDYIVTKIGGINQTKVYLFEPFCSNQEIIYRSRKSYFETLNIKLVPYDISEKGYMQLIDVLEYLYNKISKNVFIPIIDDFKKWCSRFDDKSSFKEILSQLKKEDNISHERTIVDELRKQNDSRWIKSFYEEGLFSPSFIDKKIISNDWPLLSLFLDWVSSGDLYAQNNAVCFLNLLSTNNIEQLKKNRFGVASTISSLILNLNNSLINNKFLTILADIVDLQGVLYYDKDNNDKLFYNIIRWHKNHINKVLEIIFSFANFEVYNDSNSFDIKRIMHRINNVIKDSKNNKKIIVVMFEFFVGLLLKLANKKQFNLFMRIYNIDNINKNNNEYWKIIIGEIIFCFNLMNDNNKYKYAKNLLGSKEIELNKLALYLARKFKLNIEFVHLKSNFFNNYYLYCELYQYLKIRVENFKIGNIERVYIYDMIEKATWGVVGNIDEYEKNNIINSKKIEILSLFEFEEFKIKKQQYEKSGFKSYDVMHISDEVDYIKVYVWEPTIKFQKENFSEEPVNNWCKKFIDTLPNDDDDRYAYAEEFVKMIMFKNKDDVKIILDDLSNIKFEILKYVVIQMQTQMEQSSNNDIIFSFCLKILERLYMQKKQLVR